MKKILLKKLTIQNFLSIGNEPVIIEFEKGLHIITGNNLDKEDSKNGVGKSAITDALFFVLFGETLRPLNKEDIINKTNKKNCGVQLDFEILENQKTISITIKRSISPSSVQLTINGQNKNRTIPKTNEMIMELTSFTPELLKNTATMNLNNTEPFLAQKSIAKRKFIESVFSLSVFGEMSDLIKADLNNSHKQYDIEKSKIVELQNSLQNYSTQQLQQQERKEKSLKELEERKKVNEKESENLIRQITVIDTTKEEKIKQAIQQVTEEEKRVTNKKDDLIAEKAKQINQIDNVKTKIKEINELGNACTKCKRPFTDNEKLTHGQEIESFNKQITEFTNKISNIEQQIKEIDLVKKQCVEGLNKLVEKTHEIRTSRENNKNLQARIMQIEGWNKQILGDINKLNTESNSFDSIITETKDRLKILEEKFIEIQKNTKIYEVSKFIVSEEGVRSFIVNKMIKLLNNSLDYYLKRLDTNCHCTFNEYFEETMTNNKNQPYSYFNYSNGEQKRIDLSMIFTFMGIRQIQTTVTTNFAFYDELLDTSLDSKGIEDALQIIKEQVDKDNKAVFIISHKKEAVKYATSDIIYLEKQNGITRRKKYVPEI